MSNPTEGSGESPQTQLSRSLVSLWEGHSGARPKSITTEITGNVVRCEIDSEAETPDSAGYRHAATSTVARITGRRVTAFIPKRDKGRNPEVETFVLERPQIKF
jgi:hypothetical protein